MVDENRMSFNWLYRQRTTEFIQTLWSIFFYLFKILLNCKNSLITDEVDEKHIISLNWLKKKEKRKNDKIEVSFYIWYAHSNLFR